MSALLFFARPYWRVLAIAAAIGLLLLLAERALDRAYDRGYEAARDEMAEQVRLATERTAAAEEQSRQRIQQVDHDHQKALADLDARYAARPVPAVRVCPPARSSQMSPAPSAPSSDPAAARADGLPGGVSADIGPAIERRILRPADIQAQRLIACQAYVREIQSSQ